MFKIRRAIRLRIPHFFLYHIFENCRQWKADNGNGLYPPPSLQALLRTYIIENVDKSFKHSVAVYLFFDLAMMLDQNR